MNAKQVMMLSAMMGAVQPTSDSDESIAFIAIETFMEKKTYGHGLKIERITYPMFLNVHDIFAVKPRVDSQYCTVDEDVMVVSYRSGGHNLVTVEQANKIIVHIRKLQGY